MQIDRRTCTAAVAMALVALVGPAPGLATDDAAPDPPPAELLEAKTICVMDMAVMDSDLKARFRSELEAWERFEIVMFPDEADVLMALSARSDFTSKPVDEDCDPEDPLCDRASGTAQVFETLYLKVFVPGGDELWLDQEPVGADDGAAKRLVERLRTRLEGDGTNETESPGR